MSRFIKKIALFLAGVTPFAGSHAATVAAPQDRILDALNDPQAVTLRPLNREQDNLFAGHRSHSSHSSHASHSSHYSGSSSRSYDTTPTPSPAPYYYPSSTTTPVPQPAPSNHSPSPANSLVSPTNSSLTQPSATANNEVVLSNDEKLKLQILRIQIKLHTLKLYEGPIDGARNPQTAEALRNFQKIKGLKVDGLMTTETLNALGILAVN